jgi:hypothetical protein
MNDRFAAVLEEIELILAEAAQLMESGPKFRVVHRFQQPGTDCRPGEEIASIWLIHRSREYPLRFPLALRLLFDYLARHRWLAQTASQIEAGIRRDAFSLRHGANVRTSREQTRRIHHSTVKEYVKRIRQGLQQAFAEAGLDFDPRSVLMSEKTMGNEVTYRLKASVTWLHSRQ